MMREKGIETESTFSPTLHYREWGFHGTHIYSIVTSSHMYEGYRNFPQSLLPNVGILS